MECAYTCAYHNHHHEFIRQANGQTIMDYLVENLNPETIETELLTLEEVFSIETEAVTDYDKIKTIFKQKS